MNDDEHGKIHSEKLSWIVGLIGVIVGIVIQFGAGIYWAGRISESLNGFDKRLGSVDVPTLETRVTRIEGEISASGQNEIGKSERLAKLEERTADILDKIGEIKSNFQASIGRIESHIAAIEADLKSKRSR